MPISPTIANRERSIDKEQQSLEKRGHISTMNYTYFVAGKSVECQPLVSPADGFFHRVEKVRAFWLRDR
jgi:hypothetical protein